MTELFAVADYVWCTAVGGAIVLGAMLFTHRREVLRIRADQAVRLEMARQGRAADDIARALAMTHTGPNTPPSGDGRSVDAEFLRMISTHVILPMNVGPMLVAFRAIPEAQRPSVFHSVKEMIDAGASEAVILAGLQALADSHPGRGPEVPLELSHRG